jgi:hypothetical protein
VIAREHPRPDVIPSMGTISKNVKDALGLLPAGISASIPASSYADEGCAQTRGMPLTGFETITTRIYMRVTPSSRSGGISTS